ncbi:MAG: acetyl-CoA carboxylase biotin carboxylase subunit [bacterium]
MIQTILIANRGEIACRIIRTCRRLGIRSVAVFSDADTDSLHVKRADEAVGIGAAPATESYLNAAALIEAAERTGADAIHPGYGFLAENADFARACTQAGIIFIGPRADAIAAMGNKRTAKELMLAAGVPVIPGYHGSKQSDDILLQEARRIGFPVLVKAAAGGGGKGMRLATTAKELDEALSSARRESRQAFGAGELILERALTSPRHIEFQILGDQKGQIVHLGERECSIQRRHQKIIEETPSPILTPDLRARMGDAAVAAARAVGYHNAGTVEFLLDAGGTFYFLEMNTRLQVEHPITEAVTGIDLVEWQIRIAEGEELSFAQKDAEPHGHAIEARVYAENPEKRFLPVTGDVHMWRTPKQDGIRIDDGIETGDHVSVYYDPILAKIIACGPNRALSIRRLAKAVEETVLLGFVNNLTFLRDLLLHPDFLAGRFDTGFVTEHFSKWRPTQEDPVIALIAATLARRLGFGQRENRGGYWRNVPNKPPAYRFTTMENSVFEVCLTPLSEPSGLFRLTLSSSPETSYTVQINARSESGLILTINGRRRNVTLLSTGDLTFIHTRNGGVTLRAESLLTEPKPPADAGGSLRAPMPGMVTDILVKTGEKVKERQTLMKLEAMKMELSITTAADGTVEDIYFSVGDRVEADAELLKISEKSNP